MSDPERQCGDNERNGGNDHAAEQKDHSRDNGQPERFRDALLFPEYHPTRKIQQYEYSVRYQINLGRSVKPKAEIRKRNVEYHQSKA